MDDANSPRTMPPGYDSIYVPKQALDRDGETTICTPFYPFPDAVQTELIDRSAVAWHDQYCGEWLRSGATLTRPDYWAFRDEEAASRAIVEATRAASAVPSDAVGKVRRAE